MTDSRQPSHSGRPALSLILCSRNDNYMGDSRWRLQTALNATARQVAALGRAQDVEILVADWGSDPPLTSALMLEPAAAGIVSFVHVPPALARERQRDSPFPEVLALNAAARRARGAYIGQIDQDLIVGRRFFEWFFARYDDGSDAEGGPLHTTLWFANRRNLPYRFAVRCPPLVHVECFVQMFRRRFPVWRVANRPFWTYWLGIWLAHRDIWHEARGFDERLIYYNWMEVEMIWRLRQKYDVADLGALVDYDFHHLEHLAPGAPSGTRHAKKNPDLDWRAAPSALATNDEHWGFAAHPLSVSRVAAAHPPVASAWRAADWLPFTAVVAVTTSAIAADAVRIRSREWWRRWSRRASALVRAVQGRPVTTWPRVAISLWSTRRLP